MVVDFKWAEAVFTTGKKLNGVFAAAFAALETLDEAHGIALLSTASTTGNKKSPVPNKHGAFSKPSRSCLAVFYVEQVALNRHVLVKKEQTTTNEGQKVYRPSGGRQVELFQLVSRGISRFENVGSAVLAES